MLGLLRAAFKTRSNFWCGLQHFSRLRSYRPSIDDEKLDGRFVRAQEVSRYVEHGYFDCGLTGQDWVKENDSDVVEVCSLIYSRASNMPSKWVIAVPEASTVQTVKDLEGKRIATEVVNITRQYLNENGVNAEVEFSWGATEVKVPDLVDAIVDLTETGNSIRANNLRIVDTLLNKHCVDRQQGFLGKPCQAQEDRKHRITSYIRTRSQ